MKISTSKLSILFISLFLHFCSFGQTHFTATLSGDQANPAVTTDAKGTGVFLLTDAGLEFHITAQGLEIANAHFHSGAIGANGGVVRSILPDFNGKTASGIWTSSDSQPLTDELIRELMKGNFYINIHTADNPGGEIRGQVLPSAGTSLSAYLTGNQVNPPVTTTGSGTAHFTLTDAGLIYSLTIDGLDIINAHFHNGAIGVNGGVAYGIFDDFNGNTALGIWKSNDPQPLTDDIIKDLLSGNIYVNVHTANNPGGEIRGQVVLGSGIGFNSTLSGDQVTPSVSSGASGTGSFTLTDAGLVYQLAVQGLTISNAHFHIGAPGSNGGVARSIMSDFDGSTASGVWTKNDDQPLTKEMVAELLKGNIYVNIHTPDHPGGEIRGQVNLNNGTGLVAKLSGDEVNPPIASGARGLGSFVLTEEGLEFSITVEGLEIANAHFHNNEIGLNGGVSRSLLDDFNGKTASGVWKSTDDQPLNDQMIAELLEGNMYINIHTSGNPGGEIRGQVLVSSGTRFSARLNGDQANPPVATEASGTGSFILTSAGLAFSITVEGLEIANAHIHQNGIGVNGGVARGLLENFNGNTATGIWRSTDAQPFTEEMVSELLSGNLYVNVHTAGNPGGEIRGQILLTDGVGFSANLMGEQSVPPVSTDAKGTGAFTLTDQGLVFHTTVEGLTVANAHFHNAPIGENGGVVRGIAENFTNNTASGIWKRTDAQALSNDVMAELILGNIYLNIHTADHPGGEIRGQLSPFEVTTSIESIDGSVTQNKAINLLQNIPNPFSELTKIQFQLKKSGLTDLSIFDTTGKPVATLVSEHLSAGGYNVSFESGSLKPGLYFYKLQSNGTMEVKKMILK